MFMKQLDIRKEIADFIIEEYNADDDVYLSYTPLRAYMDSLDMVDLVIWLERHFHIEVPNDFEFWQKWHRLNDIVRFVEMKLKEKEL